jgi:hypothetical protein
MIHYNDPSEQTKLALLHSFKTLGVAKILRQSGISKACGVSAYEVFKFLLLLVFQGKNLYRYLDSSRGDQAVSKNTYYRFLNESTFNWRRFLLTLSTKVIAAFSRLTRPERVNVLILDDSIVTRNRSKSVELLARIYDHAAHRYQKGFTMLTLGWSDGYSFVPVDFAMMSSANEENRLQGINDNIDKRTTGYKRRSESMVKKPTIALNLIQNALKQGIHADYVLMDTWFTNEPMIKSILEEGIDVIGMVKQGNQKYNYNGGAYNLKELRTLVPKNNRSNILGSVIVTTKSGIPVKIVFIKNRTNKREWLAVLSTDLLVSNEEIVRIYGNRWAIEVFFKSIKSFMKLGTEFQGRSYDMMISHTTIVYCRYTILEWLRREEKDTKTFGELFFKFCDDIQDMELSTALQSLMDLFMGHINNTVKDSKENIKSQLLYWINQQATFIKALFADLGWES